MRYRVIIDIDTPDGNPGKWDWPDLLGGEEAVLLSVRELEPQERTGWFAPLPQDLQGALDAVLEASEGDSNDREIEALGDALESALHYAGASSPSIETLATKEESS